MVRAIAKLVDATGGEYLGTAFAVSEMQALTAFHCIGDLDSGKVTHRSGSLRVSGRRSRRSRIRIGGPLAGLRRATVPDTVTERS